MSKYPTYIEITGNIQVHHPVRREAEVISLAEYADWFITEWKRLEAA
jgi:hypothetical protein